MPVPCLHLIFLIWLHRRKHFSILLVLLNPNRDYDRSWLINGPLSESQAGGWSLSQLHMGERVSNLLEGPMWTFGDTSPCCQDTFLIMSTVGLESRSLRFSVQSPTELPPCILFLENRQSTISCFLKNTCNIVTVLSPTVLISSCFNSDGYVDAYPPMITQAHTVRQWCRKSFPPTVPVCFKSYQGFTLHTRIIHALKE